MSLYLYTLAAEGLSEENQPLREQILNSRYFPREQIHHTTPKAFQQIVILTKSLH